MLKGSNRFCVFTFLLKRRSPPARGGGRGRKGQGIYSTDGNVSLGGVMFNGRKEIHTSLHYWLCTGRASVAHEYVETEANVCLHCRLQERISDLLSPTRHAGLALVFLPLFPSLLCREIVFECLFYQDISEEPCPPPQINRAEHMIKYPSADWTFVHQPSSFMMSAILVSFVFFPLVFSWNAFVTSCRFSAWTSRTRSSTDPSMTSLHTVVGRFWPRRWIRSTA